MKLRRDEYLLMFLFYDGQEIIRSKYRESRKYEVNYFFREGFVPDIYHKQTIKFLPLKHIQLEMDVDLKNWYDLLRFCLMSKTKI